MEKNGKAIGATTIGSAGIFVAILKMCSHSPEVAEGVVNVAKATRSLTEISAFRGASQASRMATDLEAFNGISKTSRLATAIGEIKGVSTAARGATEINVFKEIPYGEENSAIINKYFHYDYKEINYEQLNLKFASFKGANEYNLFLLPVKNGNSVKKIETFHSLLQIDKDFVIANPEKIGRIIENEATRDPKNFDVTVKKLFNKYITKRNKIVNQFGKENQLLKDFDNAVFSEKYLKNGFSSSINKGVESLIPEQLRKLENTSAINDLYALLSGRKLNEKEAELLSELTGRIFKATKNNYDNFIYIKKLTGDHIVLNTTQSTNVLSKNNFIDFLMSLRKGGQKKIVVDGKIDDYFACQLCKADIKFVRHFNTLIDDVTEKPMKTKLIFIASKNKQILGELFETKGTDELMEIVYKAEHIPNSVIVDNKELLLNEISAAEKNNEKVILIFNNKDAKLFDVKIDDYKFKHIITCNSYKIRGNFSYSSTNYLNFKDIVESLSESYTGEVQNTDDFFFSLSEIYDKKIGMRNYRNAMIGLGIGGGTTGGIGLTIYLTKKL